MLYLLKRCPSESKSMDTVDLEQEPMQRVQVYGTRCSQLQCSMAVSSMPRNQDKMLISPHAVK